MLGNSGILLCFSFIDSWLRFLRVSDNHDERCVPAPDPLVWDQGSRKKQRHVNTRVNVDLASLPGPPGFLHGPWVHVHGGCITGADVAASPYSVSLLCRLFVFFGTLH